MAQAGRDLELRLNLLPFVHEAVLGRLRCSRSSVRSGGGKRRGVGR